MLYGRTLANILGLAAFTDFRPGMFDGRPFKHGYGRYRSAPSYPSRGVTYAPNGKRECERRMRQIAAGSLRAENGLVR